MSRRRLLALAAGVAALTAGMVVSHQAPPLLLHNASPSLPVGLYRLSLEAPAAKATVAIRPPASGGGYLAALGYRPTTLLLKRIAAGKGAYVCTVGRTVEVDGWVYPRRTHDRTGAPLPAWRGCRRLRPGELFVVGETPESFDSRYFGPVRRSAVVGVYRRLL